MREGWFRFLPLASLPLWGGSWVTVKNAELNKYVMYLKKKE